MKNNNHKVGNKTVTGLVEKTPLTGQAISMTYEGIDNLRPESKVAVQGFISILQPSEM